jgi:hypothetical protein
MMLLLRLSLQSLVRLHSRERRSSDGGWSEDEALSNLRRYSKAF